MNRAEIMDTIQRLSVGDKIQVNNWEKPMNVCAVSNHYVLAYSGQEYTIISKSPQEYSRNNIEAGSPFCGADWWIFGYGSGYRFDDNQWCDEYMNDLETGETEISERNREAIYHLDLQVT